MDLLLTLFYRLPLNDISQGFTIGSLVFLLVQRRYNDDRRLRRILWGLWFLSVLVIVWATVLRRSPRTTVPPEFIPFHSIREDWAMDSNELRRSNYMNAALFFPGGILTTTLLPRHWSGWKRLMVVLVLFISLSIGIEYTQYRWCLGEPDIDDVIFNTLGAALGTLPILLETRLFGPKKSEERS